MAIRETRLKDPVGETLCGRVWNTVWTSLLPLVGTVCGRVAELLPGPSFALLRNLRRMFLTLTTNAVSVLNLPLTTNVASVLKLPLTTNVHDAYDECCFGS